MRINILIVAAITAANFAHGQFGSPPQLNAPVSGEMLSTQVQTLADGTHISQPEHTTKFYRDSLGRSRSEEFFAQIGAPQQAPLETTSITITDPVEGVRYILNPRRKTAQKIVTPKRAQPSAAIPPNSQGRAVAQSMTAPQQAIQLYPSGTGTAVMNGRVIGNSGGGAGGGNGPQSKNESLGTQTIEGLIAEGHRMTTTWPVGTAGNDRDIVTYNEFWRSTELEMTVLSKNFDPRTGERLMKLVNISRTEPDPALFQVPSDYTIEEQPIAGARPSGQNGVVVR